MAGNTSSPVESVITVPVPEPNSQHVYISDSQLSEDGSQVTVTLSYKSDTATTTGIGFTVNFNSDVLSVNEVSNVFADAIASGQVQNDPTDWDNDSSTNTTLSFGWASIFSQFPGSTDADLATVTFDIAEGAPDSTALNIAKLSSAANFSFEGYSHDVIINPQAGDPNLSIDSATGTVTLNVDPNFEDVADYSFEIISTSDRSASGTSAINNLDEVAPTITSGSDAGTVDENGAAQVVYTATADDSGDISNGVSYSLYQNTESFAAPTPAEGTQHLYVSEASLSENDTKLTVKVSYDSLDPETAGLGLRVHYDSAALTLDSISDALVADLVFTNPESSADSDDFDENANTDTYVDAGWASIYGDWPSETLPAGIMTLTFDVNPSAASTEIGLSSLASPVGFGFDGPSQTVSLSSNVGDTLGAFSIDSASGEVTFAGGADYEAQSEYNFAVVATDAAGNASEPQSVTLSVTPTPDLSPLEVTTYDLNENSGAGQVIATVDNAVEGETFSLAGNTLAQQNQ